MTTQASVILYGFWRSSATWRVRVALRIKNIVHDYRPVNLLRGDGEQHDAAYRALNPLSQVPLLETQGANDVTLRISQSLAIIEYLEERYPEPHLLPSDVYARAQVRQIAEMINAGIQPFGTSSVGRYVRDVLQADQRAWAQHWLHRGLAALDLTLRGTAGRFAVGDELSLADACLIPQLYQARRLAVPVEEFATLLRVEQECSRLDAFVLAHAENQPDYPTPR